MIKVKVKAPWYDGKGLHKVGDLAEVETAAFNPLLMEEVRSTAKKAEEDPEKPAKTTKKTTTKKG